MPFKTFTAGSILTASDVQQYLMNQTIVVCTSATRPTPTAGTTIYETDTSKFGTYDGTAWSTHARIDVANTWTANQTFSTTTTINGVITDYAAKISNAGSSGYTAVKFTSASASAGDADKGQITLHHSGYVGGVDVVLGVGSDGAFRIGFEGGGGFQEVMKLVDTNVLTMSLSSKIVAGSISLGADPGSGTASRVIFTAASGVGNGASTGLTALAKGTGSGPASLAAASWVKVYVGTTAMWVPAFA